MTPRLLTIAASGWLLVALLAVTIYSLLLGTFHGA
jgi:hypothetical protein